MDEVKTDPTKTIVIEAPASEDAPVIPPTESQGLNSEDAPTAPLTVPEIPKYYQLDQIVEPVKDVVPEATEVIPTLGQVITSPDKLTFAWTGLDTMDGKVEDRINFSPKQVVIGSKATEEDVSIHNPEITEVTTIAAQKLQELAQGGSLKFVGDEYPYISGSPKSNTSYDAERKALYAIMIGLSNSGRSHAITNPENNSLVEFSTFLPEYVISKARSDYKKDVKLPAKTYKANWVKASVVDAGITNTKGKKLVVTRGTRVDASDPLHPKAKEELTASWRTPEEIDHHVHALFSDQKAVQNFQKTYKPIQKIF